MLRINRSRFIGIACLTIFIYFLVFTDSGSTTTSEFRTSTEASLARIRSKHNQLPLRGDLSDEDLTRKTYQELQGILESQKEKAQKMTHDVKDSKVPEAEEDPVAASRKAQQKPKYPIADGAEKILGHDKSSKSDADEEGVKSPEEFGKDFSREKLMDYLKYPVVIFSKTLCPHSRRAKQLLLEIYNINPKPLVVELDMLGEKVPQSADPDDESHVTLGKALQDLLGEISGRKTVPNIMVGGSHSIGGNDKIWELHEAGLLAEEIKKLGGRKVVSVDVHDSEDDGQR